MADSWDDAKAQYDQENKTSGTGTRTVILRGVSHQFPVGMSDHDVLSKLSGEQDPDKLTESQKLWHTLLGRTTGGGDASIKTGRILSGDEAKYTGVPEGTVQPMHMNTAMAAPKFVLEGHLPDVLGTLHSLKNPGMLLRNLLIPSATSLPKAAPVAEAVTSSEPLLQGGQIASGGTASSPAATLQSVLGKATNNPTTSLGNISQGSTNPIESLLNPTPTPQALPGTNAAEATGASIPPTNVPRVPNRTPIGQFAGGSSPKPSDSTIDVLKALGMVPK